MTTQANMPHSQPKSKRKTDASDYQTLSLKLDEVLEAMQSPDMSVDDAVRLYERGVKLVAQLEEHLQTATNEVAQVRLASDV